MDNILKVAIPSSSYHKRFSSELIHNFIIMARQVCEQSGIECFTKDQEDFPKRAICHNDYLFSILIIDNTYITCWKLLFSIY